MQREPTVSLSYLAQAGKVSVSRKTLVVGAGQILISKGDITNETTDAIVNGECELVN